MPTSGVSDDEKLHIQPDSTSSREASSTKNDDANMPLAPKKSEPCSEPLYRFLRRHFVIFDFFFLVIQLATTMDKQRLIAIKALAQTGGEKEKKRLEEAETNKDPNFNRVKSFSGFQSETLVIRLVDNFLCFLSETIQACISKRPEMLRSSETIRVEDVLKLSTYDELVSFLVDRKMNELSYGGFREIENFLKERTGIELIKDDNQRILLTVSIELRNIYTHNRGQVNDLFLKRVGDLQHGFKFTKGERFHAEFDAIARMANNMVTIARQVDTAICKKFAVRRSRYNTWFRRLSAATNTGSKKNKVTKEAKPTM